MLGSNRFWLVLIALSCRMTNFKGFSGHPTVCGRKTIKTFSNLICPTLKSVNCWRPPPHYTDSMWLQFVMRTWRSHDNERKSENPSHETASTTPSGDSVENLNFSLECFTRMLNVFPLSRKIVMLDFLSVFPLSLSRSNDIRIHNSWHPTHMRKKR